MKLFNIVTTDKDLIVINPYKITYCTTDPNTKETTIYLENGSIFKTMETLNKICESSDNGFTRKV